MSAALQVDSSLTFDQIGGLDGHVDKLKEMIFLPLTYPELFERFHISPPRGMLFYGPPGVALRLAWYAECQVCNRIGDTPRCRVGLVWQIVCKCCTLRRMHSITMSRSLDKLPGFLTDATTNDCQCFWHWHCQPSGIRKQYMVAKDCDVVIRIIIRCRTGCQHWMARDQQPADANAV